MAQNLIAAAINIDPKTLRRAFADELRRGLAVRRAEVINLLFIAGRKGNVAALKKLEEMTRLAAAQDAMDRRGKLKPVPDMGKKATARERARQVGTGRLATPPAPPRLLIDNGDVDDGGSAA